MITWKMLFTLLFGKLPPVSVRTDSDVELPWLGRTLGTFFLGRPGSGKTTLLARLIVAGMILFPRRAVFVLDASGSLIDTILAIILRITDPTLRTQLIARLVYDDMGNREWIMPRPEFSPYYGPSYEGNDGLRQMYEEQIQRWTRNLIRLAPELVKDAPFLAGLALRELAPQMGRLLTAITNEHGETWQVPELKKLIVDSDPKSKTSLLPKACKEYGRLVPEAKYFLEKVFMPLSRNERELRSYALLAMLGVIEPPHIRARLGYFKPAWTPKDAIAKGLVVLVDGANLINEEAAQHYLFVQVYSQIMADINHRRPADPADQPVSLVIDEVYSLLAIPGMAEEIARISPQYRARKLELTIVLQALGQVTEELRKMIWSIGNIVVGAVENKDECLELALQLFQYNPTYVKVEAKQRTQQPIYEAEKSRDRLVADWIHDFKQGEFLVKRYLSEVERDPRIRYVPKAPGLSPTTDSRESEKVKVDNLKEQKLRERAIPLREALEVVNNRNLNVIKDTSAEVQGVQAPLGQS